MKIAPETKNVSRKTQVLVSAPTVMFIVSNKVIYILIWDLVKD